MVSIPPHNEYELRAPFSFINGHSIGVLDTNNNVVYLPNILQYYANKIGKRIKIWNANESYKQNDIVFYDNKLYKAKNDIAKASSFVASNYDEIRAIPTKVSQLTNDSGYTTNTGTITGVSVNGTSVATSGVANITNVPASILSGAIPSAVTATTQNQSDNSTKLATTAYVRTAIDNLPDPMVFKGSLGTGGTITALPTNGTASVGDTYKVITAGTYANKAAKVGDTFICLTKTSSANTWELIPSGDEPSGTVTSVKIEATGPIAVNDSSAITTSGTRTISHANSGVTAGTYRSVTVNATGHVTAGTNPTTLSGYGITDALNKGGGTLTGELIMAGKDIKLSTIDSSSDDSGDIAWFYGNGQEKARLWTSNEYSAESGLSYRLYKKDGTSLFSGTIPLRDTKNTAGSTDTSSKIYLIGATSQAANPQTYSDNEVYATSGVLTTKSVQVGGTAATMQYNSTDKCIEFVFA